MHGVIITAIICGTLIVLAVVQTKSKKMKSLTL